MNKIILLLLIASFFTNSCKKINSDCRIYMGQYEWYLSNKEGVNMEASETTDRFAIVIEERKILFYKNGRFVKKEHIEESTCNDERTVISYGTGKDLNIYTNEMISENFPYYGSLNCFYKVK